jgi:AraC-like DNA-binding protein
MRLFKKEMSITINNYINCLKINKSLKFLQNNTVLNAALNNGFSSQEYFSEMFKKIIGVSPTSYKKFVNHNKNISNSSIEIIRNSIIELNTILDKKNNYLLNRKPDTSIIKFPSL